MNIVETGTNRDIHPNLCVSKNQGTLYIKFYREER